MKTTTIVRAAGIAVGAIALITLVVQHPVTVAFIVLGAVAYFVADMLL